VKNPAARTEASVATQRSKKCLTPVIFDAEEYGSSIYDVEEIIAETDKLGSMDDGLYDYLRHLNSISLSGIFPFKRNSSAATPKNIATPSLKSKQQATKTNKRCIMDSGEAMARPVKHHCKRSLFHFTDFSLLNRIF
jgi:hypothetical protein